MNATDKGAEYFSDTNADWAMSISPSSDRLITIQIDSWPDIPTAARRWTETSPSAKGSTVHVVKHLQPGVKYELTVDGQMYGSLKADKAGQIQFKYSRSNSSPQHFQLAPVL
jgi:hypothetical protein